MLEAVWVEVQGGKRDQKKHLLCGLRVAVLSHVLRNLAHKQHEPVGHNLDLFSSSF